MKGSFDKAFKITIGLEGNYSNDPDDPGGETKFGIAKRYHPNIDIKNLSLEQAKDIYYTEYWLPSGCDNVPFPMDICLFDSAVNPQNDPKMPGGGNQEILNMKPENWQEYMIFRMQRYKRCSKAKYVDGHINRVLQLCEQIRALKQKE